MQIICHWGELWQNSGTIHISKYNNMVMSRLSCGRTQAPFTSASTTTWLMSRLSWGRTQAPFTPASTTTWLMSRLSCGRTQAPFTPASKTTWLWVGWVVTELRHHLHQQVQQHGYEQAELWQNSDTIHTSKYNNMVMSRLSCDRTQAPFTPASEGQLIHVVATHRRTIHIMSLSWLHLSWVQSITWAQCSTCMLCHYYAEIFGCVAKRLDYMNQITEHFRLALHMLKHLNAWRQSQPHSNGCCGCIVGVPGALRARQLVLSPVLIGSHTIWQQQGFASHLLGRSHQQKELPEWNA